MKAHVLLLLFLVSTSIVSAQIMEVKGFDYSMLEDKTLMIPSHEMMVKYAKVIHKRNKKFVDETKTISESEYNTMWTEVMTESGYQTTPYKVETHDPRGMLKAKDEKTILLYYTQGEEDNWMARLFVTGPKKKVIGQVVINSLNLFEKADMLLMMNLLNQSMLSSAELDGEGKKKHGDVVDGFKQGVVDFADNITEMTFLVPESEDEKKAEQFNEEIKAALPSWTLCKTEFVTLEELEKRRAAKEPNTFYFKDFPVRQGAFFLRYNMLLSTSDDTFYFGRLGKKKLDASSMKKLQEGLIDKAERFRSHLSK